MDLNDQAVDCMEKGSSWAAGFVASSYIAGKT
jgi:hypothetical protein